MSLKDNKVSWGKYYNLTVARVVELDPEYARWCAANLTNEQWRQKFADALKAVEATTEPVPAAASEQAAPQRPVITGRSVPETKEEINAFLRERGYIWRMEADEIDFDDAEPSVWVLRSPDGRAVTVAQAFAEITQGRETVLAQVAEREDVEAAERTAKETVRLAAEEREQAERQAFDAARDEAIAGMVRVDARGLVDVEWQEIARHDGGVVRVGTVNGVAVAYARNSNNDGDYGACYCADPAAAGLRQL